MEGLLGADLLRALQNRHFKQAGGLGVLVGFLGFLPSLTHFFRGTIWSVSNDAPHTEVDLWLWVHASAMVGWFACVSVQLWTGGTCRKQLHRRSGYAALTGGLVGMLTGAVWTWKYDIRDEEYAAAFYTFVLIGGCVGNLVVSIYWARRKVTDRHKDHALMALMWSLDPAVHRFCMWLLRAYASARGEQVDPLGLLAYGKLPANIILVLTFGSMIVQGKRVNVVTVGNVAGELLLFCWGLLGVLVAAKDGQIGPEVYVPAFGGALCLFVGVAALVQRSRR